MIVYSFVTREINFQDNLRVKLRELKQTDSFQDYLNAFLKIFTLIEDMSEIDSLHWFLQGLHPRCKQEVTFKNPKSLEFVRSF